MGQRINLPNKLTILRLCLVLPFLICLSMPLALQQSLRYADGRAAMWYFLIAGIIFVVAMATDFLDGYLARKHQAITTFGKVSDPLADKLMTSSALIVLALLQIVPFWIVILFILRDIIVGGMRNLAASNNQNIAASKWGKAKTLLQSIGIIIIFFAYPIFDFGKYQLLSGNWNLIWLNLPLIFALVLSLYSGYDYLKKSWSFITWH